MNPATPSHTHRIGLHRRELLQVGFSGLLGLSLPAVLASKVNAAGTPSSRKPRSVILVFLTGAPSHLDTFDPKPDAPAELRGEFQTIATPVPGLRVCEHLPRLAARATMAIGAAMAINPAAAVDERDRRRRSAVKRRQRHGFDLRGCDAESRSNN